MTGEQITFSSNYLFMGAMPIMSVSLHAVCEACLKPRVIRELRWWKRTVERFSHVYCFLPMVIITVFLLIDTGVRTVRSGSIDLERLLAYQMSAILLSIFVVIYFVCVHLLFSSTPHTISQQHSRKKMTHLIVIPYIEWLLVCIVLLERS